MKLFNQKYYEADGTEGGAKPVVQPAQPEQPKSTEAPDFSKFKTAEEFDKFFDEQEEPVNSPSKEDTEVKTDTSTAEQKTEPVKDNSETPKPSTPPEAPKTDTPKDTDVLITKEFLQSHGVAEEDMKSYEKFIGKPIADLLKGYKHQASLIGKKNVLEPKPAEQPKPDVPATPIDAQKVRNDYLMGAIREQIPELKENMPPNLDRKSQEYKDWVRDLAIDDPDLHYQFNKLVENESQNINKVIKDAEYVETHAAEINDQQIEQDVKAITARLEKMGVKPEDYGINFNDDEYLNSLIEDPKNPGEPNPGMVDKLYNRTAILKPNALVYAFFEKNLDDIIAKRDERIRTEAVKSYQDGVKNVPKVPPSISQTPGVVPKTSTVKDVPKFKSVEEADAFLDELEKT